MPFVEPSSAPWRTLETVDEPAAPDPRPPDRTPLLAALGAVGAVVLAALALLVTAQPGPAVEVDGVSVVAGSGTGSQQAGSLCANATTSIVVEVGGAVLRPGLYTLGAGARVGEAIEAAGGYGTRVDAEAADRALNLAAVVEDGDEIHVPSRDEATPAGGPGPDPSTGGGRVDLNHASAEVLDTLPGIGPATAAKIIAAREERLFASLDDVVSRKVIGTVTFERIRDLVEISP
jgi:competence protein ComEA